MAILLDSNTRLIVQGLTGREGTFHAKAAAAYHTNVVGGVTPGKGGTTHEGWPVFNTVADAVKELGVPVPIVIRMKGTNVEEGKKMLAESGLNFATADTMGEAAEKVVALASPTAPTTRGGDPMAGGR